MSGQVFPRFFIFLKFYHYGHVFYGVFVGIRVVIVVEGGGPFREVFVMVRCFPRFSVFLLLSYRIFQHISKFVSTWGLCTGFIFLSAGLKGISLLFFAFSCDYVQGGNYVPVFVGI